MTTRIFAFLFFIMAGLLASAQTTKEKAATVTFTPKGTHDAIEGMFKNDDKDSPFDCDGKYYSVRNKKAKTYPFKADGPAWLYTIYWPIAAADAIRIVDGPGVSLEEFDRQEQARQNYSQTCNNTT